MVLEHYPLENQILDCWPATGTPDRETRVRSSAIFSPKVQVIPRNRWLRLNMTEKLFTGTLNKNQNKTKQKTKNYHRSKRILIGIYEIPLRTLLAHGELIGYPCSGVRRPSVRHPQFQTSSSPKPLDRSKPNFMWSLLG